MILSIIVSDEFEPGRVVEFECFRVGDFVRIIREI